MKNIILFFTVTFSILTYSQNVNKYIEKGKQKLDKKDYEGALKEFNKAIELDSTFSESYYYRASVLFDTERFEDVIKDLNKSILLNPNFTQALILRGKCNIKIENKEKACADFSKAKQLGDSIADKYLKEYFCELSIQKGENLILDFPESENWKITYQNFEKDQNIILLRHSNETLENWTEQAGMASSKGITGVNLVEEMEVFYQQQLKISPKAKFTFINKDLTSKHPWIMFSIESIYNEDCNCNESKICYFIQGKQSFYSCFRSIRGEKISNDKLNSLKEFFLKTEIVNQ